MGPPRRRRHRSPQLAADPMFALPHTQPLGAEKIYIEMLQDDGTYSAPEILQQGEVGSHAG